LIIRNNSGAGAASTLQLDGSAGNLAVTQDFTNSCRANMIPNLENLAGSNVFSGNLYMQTGGSNVVVQSDSGSLVLDGALQYVGNLTAARSFNFTGTGDILVNGPILYSTVAPISVGKWGSGTLSLRGSNTFANLLSVSGGTLNFAALTNLGAPAAIVLSGGALQYAPGNSSDISADVITLGPGGATIDTGTNAVVFASGIGNGGGGVLTKAGSGSLALNGANTYTGGTTVSNGVLSVNGSLGGGLVTVASGTLGGTGIVNGPVTGLPGGIVAPGNNSIGSLTVNNALTNRGTLFFRLNKSGAALTNDTLKGVSLLACGGTLQLAASGDQLTVGDSFKLFYATNYTGLFAGVVPTTPGAGLAWNTGNLAVNGTLAVALGAVQPQVGRILLMGTNLVLSGSGGAAEYGCSVLSSTNVLLPLADWTVVGTGVCDSNGNFTVTNGLASLHPQQFFRLRLP
jgi:autotransporter-associated beta strand protein